MGWEVSWMFEGIKITDILTSIGTIGAVIVSLYLSFKNEKKKGIVTVNNVYIKEMNENGETGWCSYRICLYNKGNKNIHVRNLTVYRTAFLVFRKVYHLDYSHLKELKIEVKEDSIVEVDLDFREDNRRWEALGLNIKYFRLVHVVFQDIEGKKYKTEFVLN